MTVFIKSVVLALFSLSISCSPAAPDPLAGKVWMRSGQIELPGQMLLFLNDGTLLMDSCWETYRLAGWKRIAGTRLIFAEDQTETPVEILKLTADELHIRLELRSERVEHHYTYRRGQFLCPDMPR